MRPILVIMAAGMGSRYGGLKQIDPVDDEGDKIIDFSIYDAMEAGFSKVVFIIRKEHLEDFKEAIGDRVNEFLPVEYAFQDLRDVPTGAWIPEGRQKPWGTAHAVFAARNIIGENDTFAVINSDDFYGGDGLRKMSEFLMSDEAHTKDTEGAWHYAMMGFHLKNTLTDNGFVSRGICDSDKEGYLSSVTERTRIEKYEGHARYMELLDDKEIWSDLSGEELVSMNFWGFSGSIFGFLERELKTFFKDLKNALDPLKAESYLPMVVNKLISEGSVRCKVLDTSSQWFGVTYKEDKELVRESIGRLKEEGVYPRNLWQSGESR